MNISLLFPYSQRDKEYPSHKLLTNPPTQYLINTQNIHAYIDSEIRIKNKEKLKGIEIVHFCNVRSLVALLLMCKVEVCIGVKKVELY